MHFNCCQSYAVFLLFAGQPVLHSPQIARVISKYIVNTRLIVKNTTHRWNTNVRDRHNEPAESVSAVFSCVNSLYSVVVCKHKECAFMTGIRNFNGHTINRGRGKASVLFFSSIDLITKPHEYCKPTHQSVTSLVALPPHHPSNHSSFACPSSGMFVCSLL